MLKKNWFVWYVIVFEFEDNKDIKSSIDVCKIEDGI